MKLLDLLYFCILLVISPFLLVYTLLSKERRSEMLGRFFSLADTNTTNPLWIHAASFGEMNLALLLYKKLKQSHVDLTFVFTTGRKPAFLLAKQQTNMPVYWLPFDFSFLVKRFLRRVKPCGLVLIETELWFNMLHETAQVCPIVISNARLGSTSYKRYKKIYFLIHRLMQNLTYTMACNEESYNHFAKLGVSKNKLSLVGNLKFDGQFTITDEEQTQFKKDIGQVAQSKLFVAGSVQPEEFPILWRALQKQGNANFLKLVLVPRHLEKYKSFVQFAKQEAIHLYTLTDSQDDISGFWQDTKQAVLLVNQMGVLRQWYAIADMVFVGGSFCPRGGQNMIEAIALGKPVFVGPYTFNFKNEVKLLKQAKALAICNTEEEAATYLSYIQTNPVVLERQVKQGTTLLEAAKGALEKNSKQIELSILSKRK